MRNPKIYLLFTFLTMSWGGFSQQILTLGQCYQKAKENHPLSQKAEVLNSQSDWELQSLDAQKYPRLDLEAQATYQSDVTSLPITLPNITVESVDKDQYKGTLTLSQLIYNGGIIDAQKELKKTQLLAQEKEIEVQLHPLKSQINQLYFSILLSQQKIEILNENISQLRDRKVEIEKMITTGSLYESAVEPIQVKILELTQNVVELNATKLQLFDQLSLVTGEKINTNIVLEIPKTSGLEEKPRAELELFEMQKNTVDLQTDLLEKQTLPKISAFATAGYGKPGLNMLNNNFDDYYIAGVKLQWNVFDFHSNKKQRLATELNKDLIENQKQVFEWNQKNSVQNYQSDILKYQTLLQTDQEIINYRKEIVQTAEKQLKHDLITPSDYVSEVNKLLEAQINQKIHEIQLALAQSNYKITLYE